ncbi:MAG: methyl-accepting chemotaxis protein [Solibacillus sp.]
MTMIRISDNYEMILEREITNVDIADEIIIIQKDMSTAILEFITFKSDGTLQKLDSLIEEGSVAAKNLIAGVEDEQSLALLEELKVKTVELFESNEIIVNRAQTNEDFSTYSSKSSELNTEILQILSDLKEIQQNTVEQKRAEISAERTKSIVFIVSTSFVVVVLGLLVAHFTSRSISNPIKAITANLKEVATGHLLIEPIHVKSNDEVRDMAESFNQMTADLRSIIVNVQGSSMQLAANAEQLTASSQESYASSQLVASAAEVQKNISEQQTATVNESNKAIGQLRAEMDEVAADNNQMFQSTDQVKTLISKGASVVTDVAQHMDTIHTTFKDTTMMMNEMAKHSTDIQTITALITEIAEQTNLLALNASIEAARAGEHGKGFAVVADEVRNLAEQSKKSATEIESMVNVMQQASANAVHSIRMGSGKVEEGLAKTSESLTTFTEIKQSIETVSQMMERVSSAIVRVQQTTISVASNVTDIQHLAENVADSANETGAATEQQLASNEEIASNAQSLANLAESLQAKVNQFNV